MSNQKVGPHVRELLAHFISKEAVPDGGGIAAGIEFMKNEEVRKEKVQKAILKLHAALASVKSAPDNPYGDDNEAIAADILKRLEKGRIK